MKTEADFKEVPKLRWELAEDRTYVARTTSRKNRADHLYHHGPGVLGWYYERNTKRKAANALKKILASIGNRARRVLDGDFDGTVLFGAEGPSDVPRVFLRRELGATQGFARKTP